MQKLLLDAVVIPNTSLGRQQSLASVHIHTYTVPVRNFILQAAMKTA